MGSQGQLGAHLSEGPESTSEAKGLSQVICLWLIDIWNQLFKWFICFILRKKKKSVVFQIKSVISDNKERKQHEEESKEQVDKQAPPKEPDKRQRRSSQKKEEDVRSCWKCYKSKTRAREGAVSACKSFVSGLVVSGGLFLLIWRLRVSVAGSTSPKKGAGHVRFLPLRRVVSGQWSVSAVVVVSLLPI